MHRSCAAVSAALLAVACSSSSSDDSSSGGAPAASADPGRGGSPKASGQAPAPPEPKPAPVTLYETPEDTGRSLGAIVVAGDVVYGIELSMHGYIDSTLVRVAGNGVDTWDASSPALAADDEHVYYQASEAIVRRPHAGGEPEVVAEDVYVMEIAVAGDAVFAIDRSRVKGKDGTYHDHAALLALVPEREPRTLVEADALVGLTVAGDSLYALRDGREIVRLDFSGEEQGTYEGAGGFYVDDAHVYANTEGGIVRYPLAGGEATSFAKEVFAIGQSERLVFAWAKTEVVAIDKETTTSETFMTLDEPVVVLVRVEGDRAYVRLDHELIRRPAP